MPDRPAVDRLLDDMDDVITNWHGSRDAMRWRPEAETSTIAPGVADLGEAMRCFAEAWRPTIEHIGAGFTALMRSFQAPEMREVLAEIEALPRVETADCHCLCQMNHELDGRCLGTVPEAEIQVRVFGGVEVPMCGPCGEAESVDA